MTDLNLPDYATVEGKTVYVDKGWQAFGVCDLIPDDFSVVVRDNDDSVLLAKLGRAFR